MHLKEHPVIVVFVFCFCSSDRGGPEGHYGGKIMLFGLTEGKLPLIFVHSLVHVGLTPGMW